MAVVAALYSFQTLLDHEALGLMFKKFCTAHHIKGTLIFAKEGINGTVAGSREAIDALKLLVEKHFEKIEYKESFADSMPFYRLKVHFKKEIVTLGVEGIDPNKAVGTYVKAKDWNALISDPDVVLIDTRNTYEVEIGTFKNAVDPCTETFRDFPKYVQEHLDPKIHKKIAMCCTGGIRCEKSTAYMLSLGFKEVYHLEGGILRYLEEIPEQESLWQGDCFVFDQRVAVTHGMKKGSHTQCHGCRMPLSVKDLDSPFYEAGVTCHRCYKKLNKDQKKRFAERQKQVVLAKERGTLHIGARS